MQPGVREALEDVNFGQFYFEAKFDGHGLSERLSKVVRENITESGNVIR